MNKILTIVVPTYNAERFLEDNLRSFCISYVLDEIEILIINDGSTDRSLEIAEKYVNLYPETFRVITKENGGHGSGINSGIKYATGKYFKVVDADDWIDEIPFRNLIHALKETDADIVYSGFLWAKEKHCGKQEMFDLKPEMKEPFSNVEYNRVYNFNDIADRLYIKMHSMTIKTGILRDNKITIDEHCYYVDSEYIIYPIPYVNTISFIKDYVYFYRIGRTGQSVSVDKLKRNEENYNRVISSLLQFYHQLGNSIPCTLEKKKYVARIIARVYAGKIKIMLLKSISAENQRELAILDRKLKKECPDVFYANINSAIKLLRFVRYRFYRPLAIMARIIYR